MSEQNTTASAELNATTELSIKDANKVAAGALIGTALEWYDFFLFSAAAALVFNVQYFTSENATAAAMASFATFGVGLAARPIGGLIFGRMGDRIGRRKVLLITIIGIGVVTGLIGLLPTYAAIGFAAPALLVLLRILQGLFVGGEWSGAMTLVVENAPLHLRARYAAIPQIGSPIGTILSSGGFFIMTLVFSQDSFDSFGWRIPFLVALPLLVVAVYLRSRLEESPVFRQLEESGEVEKSPIRTTFRDSWKQIIIGMAAALLGVGGFYLVTAFCVWYGVNVLGYDDSLLLLGSMVAAAVEIGALIWGGALGTKFGASKVILWGGVASAVVAVPAFFMFESGNPVLVVIAMTLAVSTLSLPYAASGTVLTGLFPATTRYTGVGMAQNAAGMLSGFIPLLATSFVASAGDHWWPAAAMLVFLSLFTAFAGFVAPRMSVDLPGFKH
ncbi:MFS transporter [Brevibacterium sediminis]|uniref:MHS family MFS transporter n=1 Tax=Brevibacterium sediminis TaxID=1857024 RepID=A0A5C4X4N7_9MICO|nr:MFS transporter [Brevibacterium sediminis]TNM56736.1 MHS family MFS transporter [Brevibacterium sediminis]